MSQAPAGEQRSIDAAPARAARLFERELATARQSIDAFFRWLIPIQWVALVLVVCFVSPTTWIGRTQAPHIHVVAVLALGALTALPALMWLVRCPATVRSRHAVAVTEMIFAALYIHACGGRIEAHFAIFVILPLLAAYRDTAVIATGAAVVAADHALRGIFFPLSVFGDGWEEPWRWLEHGAYVAVLGVVLHVAIRLWLSQMREITAHRADLLVARETLEEKVAQRTRELEVALVDARAGLAARSEFLSNVTHEFRTPLHGVISMTSHALEGELHPAQREAITTAWRASRELLGKVDDVLELSRTDRERMEVHGNLLQRCRVHRVRVAATG